MFIKHVIENVFDSMGLYKDWALRFRFFWTIIWYAMTEAWDVSMSDGKNNVLQFAFSLRTHFPATMWISIDIVPREPYILCIFDSISVSIYNLLSIFEHIAYIITPSPQLESWQETV